MPKIDWTKPIELEDGTPVEFVRILDSGQFPYELGHRYGTIYYNAHGECVGGYFPNVRNVSAPEPKSGPAETTAPTEVAEPADHPAHTLLKAGWLDGRNVRLWFGGDKAPDDWEEGFRVLRADGLDTATCSPNLYWGRDEGECNASHFIIAYIAKDEVDVTKTPVDDRQPDLVLVDERQTETVTIAKMTEAEADDLFYMHDYEIVSAFKSLGLIKETTRAERFTAATGIAATQEDMDCAEFIYTATDMGSHFMGTLTEQITKHRQAAYHRAANWIDDNFGADECAAFLDAMRG